MADNIIQTLVQLVQETPLDANDVDSATPFGESIYVMTLQKIRIIGETANFFNGIEGMRKLEIAFSNAGGDARKLNHFWNQVGEWWE